MLRNTLRGLIGVSFLFLGAVISAYGQIDTGGAIRFEVPHSFVINNKNLPAGKYSITSASFPDGSTNVLELRKLDGKQSILFPVMEKIRSQPSKKTELVFDQVGDTYYLTEIRTSGEDEALELEKTRSEKQTLAAAGLY